MSSVPDMLSELDDHGFTDTDPSRKVALLQDSIWEIEALEPWPFTEAVVLLNFDGTSAAPTNMPTNFRASLRLKDLATKQRILPLRQDDFEDTVGTDYDLAGNPQFYYFEGSTLKVWPVPPASTGRMKLRYLRWSDPISSTTAEADIPFPKYFHRLIVLRTLVKLYLMEDDAELASGFKAQADEKLIQMRSALWQRQFDQVDVIQATDPEEWDYNIWLP